MNYNKNISRFLIVLLFLNLAACEHLRKPRTFKLLNGQTVETTNKVLIIASDVLIVNKEIYPQIQELVAEAALQGIINEQQLDLLKQIDANILATHNLLLNSIDLYFSTLDKNKKLDILKLISSRSTQLLELVKEVIALLRLNGVGVPEWNI